MSFIYPRTAAFYRQSNPPKSGVQPYSGLQLSKEALFLSDIPCSIQLKRPSGGLAAQLPADVVSKSIWIIFIPLSAGVSNGTIVDRDIAVDDLGDRYQVSADYWNSLGYALACEKLEA